MTWTLYLLRSPRLGSTYAGITTDPERRLQQHNGERPGGAKSTRAGRPWEVVATWGPFAERGEAQRAEYGLKRLPGKARQAFEYTPSAG
jgi:putative endonuclease